MTREDSNARKQEDLTTVEKLERRKQSQYAQFRFGDHSTCTGVCFHGFYLGMHNFLLQCNVLFPNSEHKQSVLQSQLLDYLCAYPAQQHNMEKLTSFSVFTHTHTHTNGCTLTKTFLLNLRMLRLILILISSRLISYANCNAITETESLTKGFMDAVQAFDFCENIWTSHNSKSRCATHHWN